MSVRMTARIVGALFITATVAGLLAVAVGQPIADAADDLAGVSAGDSAVATGVLLELLMGMAIVAIAIVIYPVLRRFSEPLALGYVVARTLEGGLYAISVLLGLSLLSASQALGGSSQSEAAVSALGGLLVAARDWGNYAILPIVFAVSALILNTALFRARLVPRWLAVWGLAGALLYVAYGAVVVYGYESMPILAALLGLQEMALALWLIVRGFSESAFEAGTEPIEERRPIREPQVDLVPRPGR